MLTTQRRFKPSGLSASRALETTALPDHSSTATAGPTSTAIPHAPPQAPPSGLRKISFAKPAKKADTKTAYPVFSEPDNPNGAKQVFEIAARIKQRAEEIESLEGAQATDKAELRMFVTPFYFRVNQGKPEPPSSVSIPSEQGEVLVTFQNRYTKIESEAALQPILGDKLGEYFRQAFTLTVNGELLPGGQAQTIVDELQAVLAKYNALDALDVKEQIKPVKDFHNFRHTAFTPALNLALDAACPIVAMIKTKGREGK
ncbi:MAG: hypothetical protein ABSE16_20140 [Verrucomicrobiota bacterium]|jgi:hypothetical protein